ncbi:MAG TPA: glycosyltransferase family 4 protein, partial [Chloroflexota bacterium]
MDPTSRLHVMLVADSLDAGGAERHVVDLAVALQSNNYRVTVVCSSLGIFQKTLVDAGIDVVTAAPRRIKRTISVPYARGLGELIAEREPDLIHSHMYASGAAAAMATRRGIPLVHTEHSEAAWRSPRAQLWSRWTYHRCARVIAVSRPIRERLIRSDGVEPSRVEVIGSAVPVVPAPRVAARGRIERGAPLVGVVARLHP